MSSFIRTARISVNPNFRQDTDDGGDDVTGEISSASAAQHNDEPPMRDLVRCRFEQFGQRNVTFRGKPDVSIFAHSPIISEIPEQGLRAKLPQPGQDSFGDKI